MLFWGDLYCYYRKYQLEQKFKPCVSAVPGNADWASVSNSSLGEKDLTKISVHSEIGMQTLPLLSAEE